MGSGASHTFVYASMLPHSPLLHGQVGKVQGLKAKALGVDVVNKLQVLRNGQRVASIERIIFPAEQEVCRVWEDSDVRPSSISRWCEPPLIPPTNHLHVMNRKSSRPSGPGPNPSTSGKGSTA
jgi:hypothetical protein